MNKWLVLWLILHSTQHAHALTLSVSDFKEKTTAIAKQEVTLIALKKDRIQQVRGVSEQYWLQSDEKTGSALLRPLVQTPIQLFISTENNHHYVLRLLPRLDRAQPLVLKDSTSQSGVLSSSPITTNHKTQSHNNPIIKEKEHSKQPIKKQSLYPKVLFSDIKHIQYQKPRPKPQRLTSTLNRQRLGTTKSAKQSFIVYRLCNVSHKSLSIKPQTLLALTKAKAIVLPQTLLPAKGHITYLEVRS